MTEELELALEYYGQALAADGSDVGVWMRAGLLAAKCGLLSVARWCFESGLLVAPDHWLCRDRLDTVILAIGDVGCLKRTEPLPQWMQRDAEDWVRRRWEKKRKYEENDKDAGLNARTKVLVPDKSWASLIEALIAKQRARMETDEELLTMEIHFADGRWHGSENTMCDQGDNRRTKEPPRAKTCGPIENIPEKIVEDITQVVDAEVNIAKRRSKRLIEEDKPKAQNEGRALGETARALLDIVAECLVDVLSPRNGSSERDFSTEKKALSQFFRDSDDGESKSNVILATHGAKRTTEVTDEGFQVWTTVQNLKINSSPVEALMQTWQSICSRQRVFWDHKLAIAIRRLWLTTMGYAQAEDFSSHELLSFAEALVPLEERELTESEDSVLLLKILTDILVQLQKCPTVELVETVPFICFTLRIQLARASVARLQGNGQLSSTYYSNAYACALELERQESHSVAYKHLGPMIAGWPGADSHDLLEYLKELIERSLKSISRRERVKEARTLEASGQSADAIRLIGSPLIRQLKDTPWNVPKWVSNLEDIVLLKRLCESNNDSIGALVMNGLLTRIKLKQMKELSDEELVSRAKEVSGLVMDLTSASRSAFDVERGRNSLEIDRSYAAKEVVRLCIGLFERSSRFRDNFWKTVPRPRRQIMPRCLLIVVRCVRFLLGVTEEPARVVHLLSLIHHSLERIFDLDLASPKGACRAILSLYMQHLEQQISILEHGSQKPDGDSMLTAGEQVLDSDLEIVDDTGISDWASVQFCRNELAACFDLIYGACNLLTTRWHPLLSRSAILDFQTKEPVDLQAALRIFRLYREDLMSRPEKKRDSIFDLIHSVASTPQAEKRSVRRLGSDVIRGVLKGTITLDGLVQAWVQTDKRRDSLDIEFAEFLHDLHIVKCSYRGRFFETEFKYRNETNKRMDWQLFFRSLRDAKSEARKALSFSPNSPELWCLFGHMLKDEADGLLDETVGGASAGVEMDPRELHKDFRERLAQADRCFKVAKEISAGDWAFELQPNQLRVVHSFHFWPGSTDNARSLMVSNLFGQVSTLLLRNQSHVFVRGERSLRELMSDAHALLRRIADSYEEQTAPLSREDQKNLSLVYRYMGKTRRKVDCFDYRSYVEHFRRSLRLATDASANVAESLYRLHATRLKLMVEINPSQELFSFLEEDLSADMEADPMTSNSMEERKKRILEDAFGFLRSCRSKDAAENGEYYFKAIYAIARAYLILMDSPKEANRELSVLFTKSRELRKTQFWNYRYSDCGAFPIVESERKYVFWKCKLVRLYGAVLASVMDAESLLSLIYTVKKRLVDGETFDAETLPSLITNCATYCEQSVSNDSGLSMSARVDAALRLFWRIFGELCTAKVAQVPKVTVDIRESVQDRVEHYFSLMRTLANDGKADLPLEIPATMTAIQYCKSKWG
uniref:Uncharacterized protein n=1 Tax=Compsopogon caeruleus TaxID=31354 RepID=A0A7S1XEN8_9RHOD